MRKQAEIEYSRERALMERSDRLAGLVNNALNSLPYQKAKSFLTDVERTAKKSARHWKRIAGLKTRNYVYEGLKEGIPKMNIADGEMVSTRDISHRFAFCLQAVTNNLLFLQEELGIFLMPTWGHISGDYFFRLAPEDSYPGRIPVARKPKLEEKEFIVFSERGGTRELRIEQAKLLGINGVPGIVFPPSATPPLYFNDFGSQEAVIKECEREMATIVRAEGYLARLIGNDGYAGFVPHLTSLEAGNIFNRFLEKTRLPTANLEGKPMAAYHPKIIRQRIKRTLAEYEQKQ